MTGLLLFRRVGGTEERGRKGEKGAGSGPSQCGNNSDPRSRKVAWEVALRWRQGGGREEEGGVSMARESWDKAGRKYTLGCSLAKARLPGAEG